MSYTNSTTSYNYNNNINNDNDNMITTHDFENDDTMVTDSLNGPTHLFTVDQVQYCPRSASLMRCVPSGLWSPAGALAVHGDFISSTISGTTGRTGGSTFQSALPSPILDLSQLFTSEQSHMARYNNETVAMDLETEVHFSMDEIFARFLDSDSERSNSCIASIAAIVQQQTQQQRYQRLFETGNIDAVGSDVGGFFEHTDSSDITIHSNDIVSFHELCNVSFFPSGENIDQLMTNTIIVDCDSSESPKEGDALKKEEEEEVEDDGKREKKTKEEGEIIIRHPDQRRISDASRCHKKNLKVVIPSRMSDREERRAKLVAEKEQQPAQHVDTIARRWQVSYVAPQYEGKLHVDVTSKTRCEKPMGCVPDTLYSSLKYEVRQHVTGPACSEQQFLLGKITVIDSTTGQEVLKDDQSILKGIVEGALTRSVKTTSGPARNDDSAACFEGVLKCQFNSVSYHHGKARFQWQISYFIPEDLDNPILKCISAPFLVLARKASTGKRKRRAQRSHDNSNSHDSNKKQKQETKSHSVVSQCNSKIVNVAFDSFSGMLDKLFEVVHHMPDSDKMSAIRLMQEKIARHDHRRRQQQ